MEIFNTPLVSIIIPVYNTEKYIQKCLDTILNQSYSNIEILCVEDCSEDDSYNILLDYKAKDSRIRVYKNEVNLGASAARNKALENISGELVCFIDSDDYIDQDYVKFLVDKIISSDADCVININELLETANGSKPFLPVSLAKVPKDVLIDAKKYCGEVTSFVYNRIYKYSIIKDNHLTFSTDLKYAEDLLFHYQYLAKSKQTLVTSGPHYHYCIRNNSLCSDYNQQIEYIPVALNKIYDYYEKESLLNNEINLCNHLNLFAINDKEMYEKYKKYFSKLINHINNYPNMYSQKEQDVVNMLLVSNYESFIKSPIYRVFKLFNERMRLVNDIKNR